MIFFQIFDILDQKEKRKAVMLMLLMLLVAFFDVIGVASILPFIALVSNPSLIESNDKINLIFNYISSFRELNHYDFLIFVGIVIFVLFLIALIGRALLTYAIVKFSFIQEHNIGKKLIEKYLNQSYRWFLDKNSSDLGKSILSEISEVIRGLFMPSLVMISQIIISFFIISLVIIIDTKTAIIAFSTFALSYLLIFVIVKKRLKNIGEKRLLANTSRYKAVSETFDAIKEVKINGLEKSCIEFFSANAKLYANSHSSASAIGLLPRFFLEAIAFGGMLLLIIFLLIQNQNFQSILPILSLYAFAAYRLIPSMQQIYNAATSIRFTKEAFKALYYDIKKLNTNNEKIQISKFQVANEIKIKNINFKYFKESDFAIKNLNFSIGVNRKIGIVGLTGSGKTTFIDILLGLLEPDSGYIEVNDNIITKENLRIWQNSLGYVPQNIFLSDNTIASNVAFGEKEENLNFDKINEALETACLNNFIRSELPNGLDTLVGDKGIKLSGGQKQRIGIARAIYKNPAILIFDEATSALDNITETNVMKNIDKLKYKKTLIIIAHRLSTIKNCDEILFFDKGEVIAKGKYNILLEKNEKFKKICEASDEIQ